MSLLIEALKEAERAKEQARQSGKTSVAPSPITDAPVASSCATAEPSIEDNGDSPVLFLDLDESELPTLVAEDDLTVFDDQSIDLFKESSQSSDLPMFARHKEPQTFTTATATAPQVEPEQAPEPAPEQAPKQVLEIPPQNTQAPRLGDETRSAMVATAESSKIAAAQQKAQAVFTAKQPHRKHRLLLIGAFATITLLGFAGVAYYWQNTQTTIAFTADTPTPDAAPPQTDATEPPATTAPTATTNSSNTPSEEPAAPDQETAESSPALAAPQQELPAVSLPAAENKLPATHSAVDKATMTADALRAAPRPRYKPEAIRIYRETKADEIQRMLSNAYRAFNAGDFSSAQQLYQRVLLYKPNNRDALLGMAALALDRKQFEQAITYYAKILDTNPTDPEAIAGLVSLQTSADPAQSESYLKKALSQHPQAAAVHFALGNVYARQMRWSEAQQSYFNAYSNTPDNADYAFNLAVSLDRLNQSKLALDYYQRAIAYARNSPAGLDPSAAQARVRALQSTSGQPKP
jgi:tetratricopeptide (TPR) repeat protein